MTVRVRVLFFTVASAAFFATFLFAQTTEVTIGASKDNTLYESLTGNVSNGAGEHFFVGKTATGNTRRALIAFDIPGNIAAGTTIENVVLTLNLSLTNISNKAQTIELHRVTADWGEGTSNAGSPGGPGSAASSGDATWLHRFFDRDTWLVPGGDFSTTVSGSQEVDGVGTYTWASTDEMVADVQGWLDDPSSNFGWILIGNEGANQTAKRFDTKENTTPSRRPRLVVTFLATSVSNHGHELPVGFNLAQNYPNPFNPSTLINYTIPQASRSEIVTLNIFNVQGRKVKSLVNIRQSPGTHNVRWDGTDEAGRRLASGVYVYRLEAGNFVDMKKMVFVR